MDYYALMDTDEYGNLYEVMAFNTEDEARAFRDNLVDALESENDRATIWDIEDAIKQIDDQLDEEALEAWFCINGYFH